MLPAVRLADARPMGERHLGCWLADPSGRRLRALAFLSLGEPLRELLRGAAVVDLDRERCIQCARCTRFAEEIAGDPLIDFVERGDHTQVLPRRRGEEGHCVRETGVVGDE